MTSAVWSMYSYWWSSSPCGAELSAASSLPPSAGSFSVFASVLGCFAASVSSSSSTGACLFLRFRAGNDLMTVPATSTTGPSDRPSVLSDSGAALAVPAEHPKPWYAKSAPSSGLAALTLSRLPARTTTGVAVPSVPQSSATTPPRAAKVVKSRTTTSLTSAEQGPPSEMCAKHPDEPRLLDAPCNSSESRTKTCAPSRKFSPKAALRASSSRPMRGTPWIATSMLPRCKQVAWPASCSMSSTM
mmetsp:Transcript_33181/g.83940  ORF Transcript_33181/g.83940 Transcript_33181/m.83940 type:complete len:244 (+) Transcript_33181:542-1273(+)